MYNRSAVEIWEEILAENLKVTEEVNNNRSAAEIWEEICKEVESSPSCFSCLLRTFGFNFGMEVNESSQFGKNVVVDTSTDDDACSYTK